MTILRLMLAICLNSFAGFREVNDTRTPRTIKIGESAVAVLIPAQEENLQHAARTKEERWRIVMSAAGSWSDVDTDKLKEDIYAARDLDIRPRIDL